MTDGLHLNGVWVAEVDAVLSYQANDLTKPDSLSANYSLDFHLPDTLLIRDLLENADQIDSGGKYPYQTVRAQLFEEGELIFSGFGRLTSFQGGWSVNLIQATKDLFSLLAEKHLSDLDLSRYDHPWTLPVITTFAGKAEGVVYPIIDYGQLEGDTFASDALFPAVYAHTLIRQMLLEANYYAVGGWLDEDLIKRIAIPFVNDEPQSRDAQWVEDRTARVTVGPRNTPENPPVYFLPAVDFNPVPYTVDNDPDGVWFDGKQNNYNPALKAYVADAAMRLHVRAYQRFTVKVDFGAVEATLQIMVNGQSYAQEYWSVSGPYNITGTKVDSITLDDYVSVRKGDQVQIRFTYNKRTTIVQRTQLIPIDPESTWAEFQPDPTVRPGDTWPVARNLPDLTCAELLKTIALMSSSTYQVDEVKRTVRLITLDSVIAATSQATDWSTRVEESEEPELNVILEPYAQRNNLKWKTLDKVSTYGDGVITTTAANLPPSTDLFELPFAACLNSEISLTGYGAPVSIPTRTFSGSGESRTLNKAATTPRLILVEAGKTLEVKASVLTPEGTVRDDAVTLTGCWWADRPAGLAIAENKFSLAFDKAIPIQREQTLIQRYFSGLKRVLRRPRQLTVSVMLYPDDIATLDLTRPIRLRQVRAGALDISDSFFYLNRVVNYVPGQPCKIELVPYY